MKSFLTLDFQTFKPWIWLSAVLTAIAAIYSVGSHHPDEHYQILEYALVWLGMFPASDLPWEFPNQMRPWFQPALVAEFIRVLKFLGFSNPSTWAFLLRFVHGAIFVASLWVFARSVWESIKGRIPFWVVGFLFSTLWIFPYMAVRTSSETFSTSLYLFAMGLWMRRDIFKEKGLKVGTYPVFGLVWAASVGLLIGFAFQARYQSAVLSIVVLFIYLLGPKKLRLSLGEWAVLIFSGILTLGVGALFDRAGYGTWAFPAWSYLRINLMEGKAASFNPYPFWMYGAWIAQFIPTTTLPLFAALIYLWIKKPLHLFALPTCIYFLLHSYLTNKEYRFLFPLVPLAVAALCVALANLHEAREKSQKRNIFQYRGIPWYRNFWMIWAVSCGLGYAVTNLRPANARISFMELLRSIYRPDQTWWFRSEYPNEKISVLKNHFYWPENFEPRRFAMVDNLLTTLKAERAGQVTYLAIEAYVHRDFAEERPLLEANCQYLDHSMPSLIGFLVIKKVLKRTAYFTFWKCGPDFPASKAQ